jgi:hypothetical protein
MAKGKAKAKAKAVETAPSDEKWRAESDARTLREAEEIKGDRGRLGKAAAHAKDQVEQNAKVAGLHKRGVISNAVLNRIKGFTQSQGAAGAAGAAGDAGAAGASVATPAAVPPPDGA